MPVEDDLRESKLTGPFISQNFLAFSESALTSDFQIPYIFIKGPHDGPRALIVSTIHGDELNGISIIHDIIQKIKAEHLHGEIVLLPVANVPGFSIQNRYLPDRRDLNRLFPGSKNGSEGSRLASFIWKSFVQNVDFGIDLHSASHNRWNYPHIRGNMRSARVRQLSQFFGGNLIIHSQGVGGSLRREASRRGIPFVLFEAGQSDRFERDVRYSGVKGIFNILFNMEMLDSLPEGVEQAEQVKNYYNRTTWIRANAGGLFRPSVWPGDEVEENDILGIITDTLGNVVSEVRSDTAGMILGFNQHPQVVPGRALYHIAYYLKELH